MSNVETVRKSGTAIAACTPPSENNFRGSSNARAIETEQVETFSQPLLIRPERTNLVTPRVR